jgi:hypothetical protein
MSLTEYTADFEPGGCLAARINTRVHEAPGSDWDIIMAEATAHLITAHRQIASLSAPPLPDAALALLAASQCLSATLMAIDECSTTMWSAPTSRDTIRAWLSRKFAFECPHRVNDLLR